MANEIINEILTADKTTDVLSIPFVALYPQSKIVVNGNWTVVGTADATLEIQLAIDDESFKTVSTIAINSATGTFYEQIDNYGATKMQFVFTLNSATSVDLKAYDSRIYS